MVQVVDVATMGPLQPVVMADAAHLQIQVAATLAWLEEHADAGVRADMGPRYGIHTDLAFGMPMAQIKGRAKSLGTDHDLAAALWATGWYETRIIACKVDDPALVSAAQMDAWCRDFDNWAICDTVCFSLFDRTSHRWEKVDEWVDAREEFVLRAAYALIWSLALHDRAASDDHFVRALGHIERGAGDGRHLVDKAVLMALRSIGKRRPSLLDDAVEVARRLADSDEPARRRVGRPALKELSALAR